MSKTEDMPQTPSKSVQDAPGQEIPKEPRYCVYCGLYGSTIDHIPPKTARAVIISSGEYKHYPFMTVRSCKECNCSILGARSLWTLHERKIFVKKAIKRRYKKILALPDWTEEELEELSPKMVDHIKKGLELKKLTLQRIEF